MKIALVQNLSIGGNISVNLNNHVDWINKAIDMNAQLVVFPELSMTGYEPTLVDQLAFSLPDERLDIFQKLSDKHKIIVGVGLPIRLTDGIRIGLIIFKPDQQPNVYYKKYLHDDELPYFVAGENANVTIDETSKIALAICYEISIDAHIENAVASGAKIYLASVVKSESGVKSAHQRLSELASKYEMTVMMTNAIGEADGGVCAGGSAIWDSEGLLKAQLDNHSEGIIMLDTDHGVVTKM